MTNRQTDINGFVHVKNQPLSVAGIYEYYGSEIDAPIPNKLYRVLRTPEMLKKATPLFAGQPFVNDHTMIGDGYTLPEKKGIDGAVGDLVYFKDNTVYGNLRYYTSKIKKLIDKGKKELSFGYWSEYEFKKGIWNGQPFDAIQHIVGGNHLALVDEGRMGSAIAVLDRKPRFNPLTITFDAKAINMNEDENDDIVPTEDEDELDTSETDAVYEDADHEQEEMQTLQTILSKIDVLVPLAERFAKLEERVNKFLGEEKEPDIEPVEDELPADPDEVKEDMLDPKATEDRIATRVQAELAAKQNAVEFIRPLVGTADHSARSSGDVWKYAAAKLDLKGDAETAVKAFAKAKLQQRANATQDSKPISTVHKVNGKFKGAA